MTQGDPQEKPRQAHQLDGAFPCNSTETETNENRQSGPGGTRSSGRFAAAAGTHEKHPKITKHEEDNKKENQQMAAYEAAIVLINQMRAWADLIVEARRIMARPWSHLAAFRLNEIDRTITTIPEPSRIAAAIFNIDIDGMAQFITREMEEPQPDMDATWYPIAESRPTEGRITTEETTS